MAVSPLTAGRRGHRTTSVGVRPSDPVPGGRDMHTRYRAAAVALLMTAAGGVVAIGGAAQASGSHHAGAGAGKTLTITIKSKAHAVKLSDTKFRPGNTIFKLRNMD